MNIVGEIKYFLGEGDFAQLKYSESKTSFSIDIVMVPSLHRNKGIGSILMQRVILLADVLGKDIFITARPIGNASQEKLDSLVRYYSDFGFKSYDTGLTTVYMVRKSNQPAGR